MNLRKDIKMKKIFTVALSIVLCVSMLFTSAAAMVVDSPLENEGQTKRNILNYDDSQLYKTILYSEDENLADIFTNGEGRIDHIIIISDDSGIMPLYSDVEVPANTAVFFEQKEFTRVDMSVEYKPTNLTLYYGIANSNSDHPSYVLDETATGGSGRSIITPRRTGRYYPYVANPNNKVIYADVVCLCILDLR